jgi:hypothetical protein
MIAGTRWRIGWMAALACLSSCAGIVGDYHAVCYPMAHSDTVLFESDVTAFTTPDGGGIDAWRFIVEGDTDHPIYVTGACAVTPNEED